MIGASVQRRTRVSARAVLPSPEGVPRALCVLLPGKHRRQRALRRRQHGIDQRQYALHRRPYALRERQCDIHRHQGGKSSVETTANQIPGTPTMEGASPLAPLSGARRALGVDRVRQTGSGLTIADRRGSRALPVVVSVVGYLDLRLVRTFSQQALSVATTWSTMAGVMVLKKGSARVRSETYSQMGKSPG